MVSKNSKSKKQSNAICRIYDQYHSALLCKEIALDLLKKDYDFSHEELKLLIRFDPSFALSYIPFSSNFIKAWVDIQNFVNRDTFPEKYYRDPDLVYYILSHTESFSSKMLPYITEEMLFKYSKCCSDEELFKLCRKVGYHPECEFLFKDKYKRFFTDETIKTRLKSVNPDNLRYSFDYDGFQERQELKQRKLEKIEQDIYAGLLGQTVIPDNVSLTAKDTAIAKTKKHNLVTVKKDEKNIIVHYITDLHLTHKILEKAKGSETSGKSLGELAKEEVELAVAQIAKSIKQKNDSEVKKIILIGGDVSEYYEITRAFYYTLSKKLGYNCTVLSVLGNHEIWDGDPDGMKDHDIQEIVGKYNKFFEDVNKTYMLQNGVFVSVNGWPAHITEEMLFDDSISTYLKRIFSKAELIIFGATGFSGNNESFNAEHGLYRGTIRSREEDKQLSLRCEEVYNKVVELIGSNDFICFTHNPKTDWSDDVYLPNCIYISGHTHNNAYTLEKEKRILADNQIGYKGEDYSLKYFSLSGARDYFQFLPDGIHEIHPSEYMEFAESKGYRYRYKRNDSSKLYVLKKSGFYMFVTNNKYSTCILHGGSKQKLPNKNIDYYYENMDVLAEQLLSSFQGFEDRIHEISKQVKMLGGDGKIHGCIIDIDFFNHLYLNPFDGTLTAYCATDIMSRVSFSSLRLLIEKNPSHSPTLQNMKKMIDTRQKENQLELVSNKKSREKGNYSEGTFIYKISSKAKKIQTLFDRNIIQIWDEGVINKVKQSMIE